MRSTFTKVTAILGFCMGMAIFLVMALVSQETTSEDMVMMTKGIFLVIGSLLMFSGIRAGAIISMVFMVIQWAFTKNLDLGHIAAGLIPISLFAMAFKKMKSDQKWAEKEQHVKSRIMVTAAFSLGVCLSVFTLAARSSNKVTTPSLSAKASQPDISHLPPPPVTQQDPFAEFGGKEITQTWDDSRMELAGLLKKQYNNQKNADSLATCVANKTIDFLKTTECKVSASDVRQSACIKKVNLEQRIVLFKKICAKN